MQDRYLEALNRTARQSAVAHHEGAGTTGAAITAGVPAVIVPFAVDQALWASRLAVLAVGPTPIPRRQLTTENLADALSAAATNAVLARRAAELGARIRAEDGMATAVAHFDSVLARA